MLWFDERTYPQRGAAVSWAAIGSRGRARLVTITSGGNDVDYIGDLIAASDGMAGVIFRFKSAFKPAADRPYYRVTANLKRIVQKVRLKAPDARIVLISYPAMLPEHGNCAATGVSDAQARTSRDVAVRLAAATRKAADETRAMLVDMAALSQGHDVCSRSRWVNGAAPDHGTAFHPNVAGSTAVASSLIKALGQ